MSDEDVVSEVVGRTSNDDEWAAWVRFRARLREAEERFTKTADQLDQVRAERNRLRAAFLPHADGGWTFVETHDGSWVRVSDGFAQALEGSSDE